MIIILNGAPGCGKDTIANEIKHARGDVVLGSFKKPMFEIAEAMLGSSGFADFMVAYNDRERKEKPMRLLNGKSPRQFFIWISETVIKPQFGDQYFGLRLLGDYLDYCNSGLTMVVPDGGFESELLPLKNCGIRTHIYRVHRDGCTFAGDSRTFISGDNLPDYFSISDLLNVDGKLDFAVKNVLADMKMMRAEHEPVARKD